MLHPRIDRSPLAILTAAAAATPQLCFAQQQSPAASPWGLEGKSTVNLEAGLRTNFMLDASNSLFVDLDATALGKGVTDSPLVDHKVMPAALVSDPHRF